MIIEPFFFVVKRIGDYRKLGMSKVGALFVFSVFALPLTDHGNPINRE